MININEMYVPINQRENDHQLHRGPMAMPMPIGVRIDAVPALVTKFVTSAVARVRLTDNGKDVSATDKANPLPQ